MSEPTTIIAGDSVAWTKSLADYPAPTWTLKYRLVREGKSIEIVATASGSDHAIAVLPATSAGWLPGDYKWVAMVSDFGGSATVCAFLLDGGRRRRWAGGISTEGWPRRTRTD